MGPFVSISDEPWVCDEECGDIDPDQFQDEDGTRWVCTFAGLCLNVC
jgi:hypothetical protein